MTPRLSYIPTVLLALATVRPILAQTAGSQPQQPVKLNQAPHPAKQISPSDTTITGPGFIPIGSPLVWSPTNGPDTFTANTTFSSTPVLVDNGAVKIWQQQVPTSSTSEWDLFYMQTTNGGPIAGDINADWQIVINYTLSAAVDFDQVVQQWTVNGTAVGPLTNGIGTICCAAATNPILPGWSYYNSGFEGPLPAGVQTNWRQIYVDPYNYVTSGGIDPSTANGFIFGLHFSLQQPAPVVTGVISASAFGAFPDFAPGSWIEIYGSNLAAATQTWGSSDFSGVIGPTTLGGTSVTIAGLPTYVDYVSSGQVNVQVAGGVPAGSQSLVLTTAAGSSAPFGVTVNATEPGLLAPSNFDVNGTQYVVAIEPDGSYVLPPGAVAGVTSVRAKAGDTLTMYGVGFGSVTPDIPPGQLVEELNSIALPLTVSIGGVEATLPYYGLAPSFMGLYQFDVQVPNVPAGDTVPVTFTLNGVSGTQTLAISIGN
ncbi:MAG TPA: hypothetical protein VMU80_18520 [Bryobacteraceae bacterium]|nr:hypothetical protein [Bryobacteraceae bacterium]